MSATTLGTASTIVTALAFLWYFWSIIKQNGGTRPSRMTWLLLTVISWTVAVNSYSANASDTLGPLLMNAIGSTIVLLLSLRHGVGGWDLIDKAALLVLLLVVSLSLLFEQPLIGLVLTLSFDFFALLPTMVKLVRIPEMEAASPWVLTVTANVLNVLALGQLHGNENSLEILFPPWYFLMVNGAVLSLIVVPRRV